MHETFDDGAENYYQALGHYMDERGWTAEEQVTMFRYIGHSMMSAQGVLAVLHMQEDVTHRIDSEMVKGDDWDSREG